MTDAPTTKVSIDTPPLTVTVEAPDAALDDVRRHALEIYHEVWRPEMARPGAPLGFTTSTDLRVEVDG